MSKKKQPIKKEQQNNNLPPFIVSLRVLLGDEVLNEIDIQSKANSADLSVGLMEVYQKLRQAINASITELEGMRSATSSGNYLN